MIQPAARLLCIPINKETGLPDGKFSIIRAVARQCGRLQLAASAQSDIQTVHIPEVDATQWRLVQSLSALKLRNPKESLYRAITHSKVKKLHLSYMQQPH